MDHLPSCHKRGRQIPTGIFLKLFKKSSLFKSPIGAGLKVIITVIFSLPVFVSGSQAEIINSYNGGAGYGYTKPTVDIIVSGRVTDNNGQPLAGVSINRKGSILGTTSNSEGRYEINVPDGNSVLVFSFVGFKTEEVQVAGQTTINVVLLAGEAKSLSEVVVTALGIKRELKSLAYSTQNISGSKLSEAKETNVINALQGKVAGVTITKNATGPGGDSKVIIRGNRSISGSSQPLYVIDGVPLNGNVSMLNADDIESMNILKGAAAAALYGSQGQNGAIIITTRRAKSGSVNVNYIGGLSFDRAAVLPELQYEYGQGDGGIFNAHSEHSWGPKADGQMVTLWNGNSVPLKGQPDRLKNFFRTGKTLTNTVNVNGGSEKMQTYFSYGNTLAQGIMRNNDLTRHNIDLKINNTITSKLTLQTKLTYINEVVNNRVVPGEGGTYALPSLIRSPTSIPAEEMKKYAYIDEEGEERQSYWKPGSSILLNPYWALNRVLYYQGADRILGLFQARYEFTDWLDFQVRGSLDKTILKNDRKIYADNYFSLVGSSYEATNTTSQSTNLDGLLSYKFNITDRIGLNGNVGGAMQQGKYSTISENANGLNKRNFFFMNNAKNLFNADSYGKSPQVFSVYSSATLDYSNYLFLDLTVRNDWSSALPKNNRSYFYPSVGLSGVVSEMVKMPDWVSYGKVRITLANAGFGGREYLDRNYYTVGAGGAILTSTIQSLGDYKPELTSSFETGLDWEFLDNRFGFNFTYYNTNTKNQLLLIGAAPASLFNQKYINAGLIKNSGVEMTINFAPIRNNRFTWDASLNFAKNKNKVIRLTETVKSVILIDDREAQIRAAEGGSFGDMYVKDWVKDNSGRHLIDVNGLPVLTGGNSVFLGNYNPDYMLGFFNSFNYRNFTFSILIDHRQGGYVISGTQALIDADGHSKRSLEGREEGLILDGYTVSGEKNTKSITAQQYWSKIGDRYPTGGLYAYKATNTRVRELIISYSIPRTILGEGRFLKEMKVSLTGRNLFFLYRPAPIDPEITNGINGGGLEYGALPSTRNIGFNVRLSF